MLFRLNFLPIFLLFCLILLFNGNSAMAALHGSADALECGVAKPDVDKVGKGPMGHLGFYSWACALCLTGVAPSPPSSRLCFCTCSLISDRFVLTAGHCLFGRSASQLHVVLGSADYQRGTPVAIRRVAIHPLYVFDEQGGPNDLGIIELMTPVPLSDRIRPVCLNSSVQLRDRELAVAAGWGWIRNPGPGECSQPLNMLRPARSSLLHQGHVQIVLDARRCVLTGGARPFQAGGMEICTKGWDANVQHGDSGGPLIVKRQGRWYQVGVASYGECHEEMAEPRRLPDIFASTLFYCPWIRSETRNEVQC